MADQDWNGLPYGHFGNAFYHAEYRSWQFEKLPVQPRTLEPVEGSTAVVPPRISPPSTYTSSATKDAEIPSVRHEKEVIDLVKLRPSVQAATSLIRPLLSASEAIADATQRHDPAKGQLLSFGRIFDEYTRRTTQVAAFASGSTGSEVRVVQMQLQKQGWDDSREAWLEVPVVAGEEAIWKAGGSPVQQVCFAQPLESGENLLAIRTVNRTLIFKPLLRKAGPMRLQLRLLFESTSDKDDDAPHADVTFNPWFPRQLAMIDQHARWRVWEFRSRESSDVACIRLSLAEEDDRPKTTLNDGWARLLWICNPNTVVVARRRAVTLFDISSGPSKLQDIDINVSDVSGWVVDVAVVPSEPSRILVLTTTHLQIFSVEERDGEVRARPSMRIRHFRSPEDITLRLTMFRDEQALTVIIRSALSPTVVAYCLSFDEHQSLTLHDPEYFRFDIGVPGNVSATDVFDLHLQPVTSGGKRFVDLDSTFCGRLRMKDCRFMSLTTLTKDMSLASVLYLSRPSQQHSEKLVSPSWRGGLIGTSAKIKDDFVVDDEFAATEPADIKHEPVASYIMQRRKRAKRLFEHEWTVQYKHTAAIIEQRGTNTDSVGEILVQVEDLLGPLLESGTTPMQTPHELASGELTMSDMDHVSAEIQRLTKMEDPPLPQTSDDDVDQSLRAILRPIEHISLSFSQSARNPGGNVVSTYDTIVSHWISPLPSRIPGRIRLAKEQLARRLAAELTLASHVIRVEDIEEPTETQEDAEPASQSQSWDLPMHIASSQMSHPYASQLQSQSQSVLPTPSPTGTPSVTTASSRTSAFASAEISHLKKFTTFTKPTPSALPRSLGKILNHWALGSDPLAYDWVATSRTISQQTREEEADSQLTEKQRARAHRKAERHIRRQRKEAQAGQVQMLASSQMPELVVSASQPQAAGGRGDSKPSTSMGRQGLAPSAGGIMGSSQSLGPAAASQAMAGRFGGRPPAKKKRKQGF